MSHYYERLRKIKVLNETLWEKKANQVLIDEWLDHFTGTVASREVERNCALYLLSEFMYFGQREIKELLKALYRDLYKYPLVAAIRQRNADTTDRDFLRVQFDTQLARTRFLGMGNAAESGEHLLYAFRQVNDLPTSQFAHVDRLFDESGNLIDPTISRYVFVDDFCGTGKQAVRYSGEVIEKMLSSNPDLHIAYFTLFGTTEALEKIESETRFTDVGSVYQLDPTYQAFGPQSRYFPSRERDIVGPECLAFVQAYGKRLLRSAPLGFGNGQLLLAFSHNTPNNTLPIFWHDGTSRKPWNPLFPRSRKIL